MHTELFRDKREEWLLKTLESLTRIEK